MLLRGGEEGRGRKVGRKERKGGMGMGKERGGKNGRRCPVFSLSRPDNPTPYQHSWFW